MTAIIIAAIIVFIAGMSAGIIAVVSVGVQREERDFASRRDDPDFMVTLLAPDRMTQGVRRVAGLHVLDADASVADERDAMFV
jgi:hypothetical protein